MVELKEMVKLVSNMTKQTKAVSEDNIEIETYKGTINGYNILEVEAGTTGYKGGDSGHGGRTYFRVENVCCTDISVNLIEKWGCDNPCGFEVTLGGDCELDTMIDALKFITNTLEYQRDSIEYEEE